MEQRTTTATIAANHSQFGASVPPAGSPKMMNTLRPPTTTQASSTCPAVTVWAVSHQPRGSTKTIVIVKIG
jgi:hypothetical protein